MLIDPAGGPPIDSISGMKRYPLAPLVAVGALTLSLVSAAPAAGTTAPQSPGPLSWAPPPCGDATHSCASLALSNTGSHQVLTLDNSKDWIVQLPNVPLVGGIDIDGGHNV